MITEIRILRVMEDSPCDECHTADDALTAWKAHIVRAPWFHDNKEHLVVLTLDTKYKLTGYHLVAMGSLNQTVAHPREILRPVIVSGAYAFILMHNHPSGDPAPSEGDRKVTRRLGEAAQIMDVPFLDHVIVGDAGRYFSFREAGLLL
jgi:DNA repair protein RadC